MKELEKLSQKRDQLSARIQKLKAREKEQSRKDDTRRKILLGGSLMALLKNQDDILSRRVFTACLNLISEKDRIKYFSRTE